jgi:hypothetical protein
MPSQRSIGGGFAPTTRANASCARSGGAPTSWERSLTVNRRSTSPPRGCATSGHGVVYQEISQHRAAQGPADERCHHHVSQSRVTLSQIESAKDSGHYLTAISLPALAFAFEPIEPPVAVAVAFAAPPSKAVEVAVALACPRRTTPKAPPVPPVA